MAKRGLSNMQGTHGYIHGKGKRSCVFYNEGTCRINVECMDGPCGDYISDNEENRYFYLNLERTHSYKKPLSQKIKIEIKPQIRKEKHKNIPGAVPPKVITRDININTKPIPMTAYTKLYYLGKKYIKWNKVCLPENKEGSIVCFYVKENGDIMIRVYIYGEGDIDYTWKEFCKLVSLESNNNPIISIGEDSIDRDTKI